MTVDAHTQNSRIYEIDSVFTLFVRTVAVFRYDALDLVNSSSMEALPHASLILGTRKEKKSKKLNKKRECVWGGSGGGGGGGGGGGERESSQQ